MPTLLWCASGPVSRPGIPCKAQQNEGLCLAMSLGKAEHPHRQRNCVVQSRNPHHVMHLGLCRVKSAGKAFVRHRRDHGRCHPFQRMRNAGLQLYHPGECERDERNGCDHYQSCPGRFATAATLTRFCDHGQVRGEFQTVLPGRGGRDHVKLRCPVCLATGQFSGYC